MEAKCLRGKLRGKHVAIKMVKNPNLNPLQITSNDVFRHQNINYHIKRYGNVLYVK
jgi:hypothetical protein